MIDRHLNWWREKFAIKLSPATGVRETLQWQMLGRLVFLYVVLCSVFVYQLIMSQPVPGDLIRRGYWFFILAFAFNLFFSLSLNKAATYRLVPYLHVVFDVALVSTWLYVAGRSDDVFVACYLLLILVSSLTLYQKGALFSSVLSILAFGIVLSVLRKESSTMVWMIYSALFLFLGMVGGYLSEELRQTAARLHEKNLKIEKLKALHEKIIGNMPTGLLTVDQQMRINFVNPTALHILGRTADELVGQKLEKVEPGLLPFFTKISAEKVDTVDTYDGAETQAMAAPLSIRDSHRSYFVQTKDSKHARLQQSVEITKGKDSRILRGDIAELESEAGLGSLLDKEASGGMVLLFQDVTTLRHLEDKLKQNEKLAAVGQLAAGIAHEIRNPLASMSASIEMLKGSLPANQQDENQKLMEIAIREIDRLNRLISEFLDFVKPEKFRFEKIELSPLLSEIVCAMKGVKEFKSKISIVETYENGACVLANAAKLKQVIWNLLINSVQAVQAMEKAGKITVGCAVAEGEKARFWVEDDGVGMTEDVLHHLYEPFFTTKDKGTGLGLATAYKIIEAHHGEMTVQSTPQVGTRFEVILQKA